jgi:hypothetical protein
MAGVDELELTRRLLDVPAPHADVVAAGRARLDALIAAGTGQPVLRRGTRAPGHRRLGTRRQLAAACAAVLTAAAVTVTAVTVTALIAARPQVHGKGIAGHVTMPRGRSANARPPALQTGTVQAAVLASLTAASGDILYIRRTDNTGLVNTQEWFWPSQPAPGQEVRMLTVAGGMEIEDTFYAATGDQYAAGIRGPAITGTEMIIGTRAKTWSMSHGTTIRPQLPQATSAALLRQYIAAHVWTVIGPSALAGQPAIELSAAGYGLREFLWVNARTHLPMRQVKENWNGSGSRLQWDIEYLPATHANQAKLTPAVPPGYERVPAP